MLASSMQKAANERDLSIEIVAHPIKQMEEIISFNRSDCILLGPQSKHLYVEVTQQHEGKGTTIGVIDGKTYGMMNGEKVLATAILMIKGNKTKN